MSSKFEGFFNEMFDTFSANISVYVHAYGPKFDLMDSFSTLIKMFSEILENSQSSYIFYHNGSHDISREKITKETIITLFISFLYPEATLSKLLKDTVRCRLL